MEKRDLTCIGCPMGCQLTVELEGGCVTKVTGNTCKIGDDYGRKEVTDPRRVVTSTVAVSGGDRERLPVKTRSDIPKASIFAVMDEIRRTSVHAPVKRGDTVIRDAAGTGVDVIATADLIGA